MWWSENFGEGKGVAGRDRKILFYIFCSFVKYIGSYTTELVPIESLLFQLYIYVYILGLRKDDSGFIGVETLQVCISWGGVCCQFCFWYIFIKYYLFVAIYLTNSRI